jgi:tetratricopeptide (TPR) repeat protein
VLRAHCERFGGELARVAPHLLNRVWAPPPSSTGDATERHQLFEAIADVLRRAATGTSLIVVLEDLHWAEPTTLLLLRHLARALADAPVLVLASFRDTETPSAELVDALADLERGSTRRIALSGFDDAELSDLIVSLARSDGRPAAAVLEQLRDQTAGNPLFAMQLVRHLLESGGLVVDGDVQLAGTFAATDLPASVRDVVGSRVRALGDPAHDVLQAGAVLGTEFDEDVVIDMTGAGTEEVADALDLAVSAGLLAAVDDTPGRNRFTHALVARALTAELGDSRLRRLHARAADALEAIGEMPGHAVVVELARHRALAGDRAAALHWAARAGDDALADLAPIEAARWFETALDHAAALDRPEAERADLMVRLGEARHRAGDPAARATLLDAAALAERSGADNVLVVAALAGDRGQGLVSGLDEELVAIIEAALAVADPADTSTTARLLARHALFLVTTPHVELREETAQRAIELIEASDDPTLLPRVIPTLTFALEGPGTLELRRDLAARAVAALRAVGDPSVEFWTHRAAFFIGVESGDPSLTQTSLETMTAIATDVGEPRLRWMVTVYETFVAMMEARLDDAERLGELALTLGTDIGEPDTFSIYGSQLFAGRSFAGRYAELLPLVQELVEANPDILAFRLAHAITCEAVGRVDDARAVLRQGYDDQFTQIPPDWTWMTTVVGYAVLTIELEDRETAAALYPMLLPYADQIAFSGATSQGPISAYLGKLASVLGEHDVADEHLQHALDVAVAFGWRYHEATTLVALARSQLRRTGTLDDDAKSQLDRAETIATDCALPNVLAQVAAVRG